MTSLLGPIVILGQARSIYKKRLGTFLGIMIIPTLVSIGFSIFLLASGGFLGLYLIASSFSTGVTFFIFLLVILILFLIFVIQIWSQIALLYAIKDCEEGIGVKESYRRGWCMIVSYFWLSFLGGFIILGGLLLLVVPGIIFAVWFSLAIFVLIDEDLKGMNALLKSREYVKGKWGSVFWRNFFIVALALIVSLVPVLVFYFLKVPSSVQKISSNIISLFLIPLVMTYAFLVYSNLKAMKDPIAFVPTRKQKTIFTIIGILPILVIPIILLSVVFLSFSSAKVKARDAIRQASIKQIQIGLEIFYDDNNNNYPSSLSELSPTYLPNTLVDPSTNQPYQYEIKSSGKDYKVCAQLESVKDQKCVTSQF